MIILDLINQKISFEFVYSVDGYFTFNVKVKSAEFSGATNFCLNKEVIESIVNSLIKMHEKLKGDCEIRDSDSDSLLFLTMHNLGQMGISGQIGGSHQDHFMKFKLVTDQTVLINLIDFFSVLLKKY